MKQLYSITRSDFYKKLIKNQKWQIKRVTYKTQNQSYSYGFKATNNHEEINVKPNVGLLKRTDFTVSYKNQDQPEKDFLKEHISFAQMQMVVHKIIYDQKINYKIQYNIQKKKNL